MGYKKPPRSTRFVKGRSGNQAGRPPGRHNQPPYEDILGRIVTIRENGVERRVTAAEAFLLKLAARGVEGNSAAAQALFAMIEQARYRRQANLPIVIEHHIVTPGSVTQALEILGMAKKLDPFRETARMALEPWLVEAALKRLAKPLTRAEQRIVVEATRTPRKVQWPQWWSEYP